MSKHLVLQTDFGLQDGAVSTMYGVAYQVSDDIVVSDLTHGITPFNILKGHSVGTDREVLATRDCVCVSC